MGSRSSLKAPILLSSKCPLLYTAASDTHWTVFSIVAVHGLNGHREKTWTKDDINWLRDFLPSDIPNARILTWGYDANTHSTSQISHQYLYDHAITLVSDLCLKRNRTKVQEAYLDDDYCTENSSDPNAPYCVRCPQLGWDRCQKCMNFLQVSREKRNR